MKKLLALLLVVLCFPAASGSAGFGTNSSRESTKADQKVRSLRAGIQFHREATHRWQRLAHVPLTLSSYDEQGTRSVRYLVWMAHLWNKRRLEAKEYALNPPHKAQWLCIHSYEGSWTDTGSPYYGGLQMDMEFMQEYGSWLLRSKGTADHWTPLEQMWVAERAYRTRGFYPWPNTARYCGLI